MAAKDRTPLMRNPRDWAVQVGYLRLSKADHQRLRQLISKALEGGLGEEATPEEQAADKRILRKLRAAERRTKR